MKEINEKATHLDAMEKNITHLKGFIQQIEEEKEDDMKKYETTVEKWANVAEKLMEKAAQSEAMEKTIADLKGFIKQIEEEKDYISTTKVTQMQSKEVQTNEKLSTSEVSEMSIKMSEGHEILVNEQTITFTLERVDLDDEELEIIKSHAAESEMIITEFFNNGVAEMAKVAESFVRAQ